jgi:signal transduction histidine kinase
MVMRAGVAIGIAGFCSILTWPLCACLSAAVLLSAMSVAAAAPKRVLLLQSFGSQFEGGAKDIRAELGRQYPEALDVYEILLTDTSADQSVEDLFADYLRALLSDRQPDVVVTIGGPATRFFQRHRRQLFSSAPLVLTGLEQRVVASAGLTANDTAVASSLDFASVVEIILRILPQTGNVAIVIGNSPLEQFWLGQLHTVLDPFQSHVAFTWFNELSFDEMLKRAAALPPRSAIFFALLQVDAAGVRSDERDALSRLHAVANAPIFSYNDAYLGDIVGGPASSRRDLIRQAASVVVRILRGEVAGDIKTPPLESGPPRFDWRELRRWNISESRLPPGSEVMFRPPTAWEQYRWQIVMVGGALSAQMLLIVGLFYERRRRRYAEATSRQRMFELAHINRTTTAGELSASIAHEIGQPLGAIAANGSAALRWLKRATPDLGKAQAALERVVSEAHRASDVLGTIRSMFKKSDQEKAALDVNIIVEEVLTLLHGDLLRRRILVKASLRSGLREVVANRVQLQQVILNLLVNAADAMDSVTDRDRVLKVTSEKQKPSGVLITVEDSGLGVEPKDIERIFEPFYTTKTEGMGMGLSICRSIIESHGGRLIATPCHSCGLAMQISLPSANGGALLVDAEAAE